MPKPTIVPAPGDTPAGPEIIEKAIIDLAAGMKRLNNTRLKRDTIVALLHDHSGVAKRTIQIVLNNLESLEEIWLKPAKKTGR